MDVFWAVLLGGLIIFLGLGNYIQGMLIQDLKEERDWYMERFDESATIGDSLIDYLDGLGHGEAVDDLLKAASESLGVNKPEA
jgi:hypothetical protein